MIIVICSLKEKKPISLKPIIEMSNFPIQFIQELYLKSLVPLNLEKYLLNEICMIFQSIRMLLINPKCEYT